MSKLIKRAVIILIGLPMLIVALPVALLIWALMNPDKQTYLGVYKQEFLNVVIDSWRKA